MTAERLSNSTPNSLSRSLDRSCEVGRASDRKAILAPAAAVKPQSWFSPEHIFEGMVPELLKTLLEQHLVFDNLRQVQHFHTDMQGVLQDMQQTIQQQPESSLALLGQPGMQDTVSSF